MKKLRFNNITEVAHWVTENNMDGKCQFIAKPDFSASVIGITSKGNVMYDIGMMINQLTMKGRTYQESVDIVLDIINMYDTIKLKCKPKFISKTSPQH